MRAFLNGVLVGKFGSLRRLGKIADCLASRALDEGKCTGFSPVVSADKLIPRCLAEFDA